VLEVGGEEARRGEARLVPNQLAIRKKHSDGSKVEGQPRFSDANTKTDTFTATRSVRCTQQQAVQVRGR